LPSCQGGAIQEESLLGQHDLFTSHHGLHIQEEFSIWQICCENLKHQI